MPSNELEEAWEGFQKVKASGGYNTAVAWLQGQRRPFSEEVKRQVLERAGRVNLAAIRVDQQTLTTNRRRPGAFA